MVHDNIIVRKKVIAYADDLDLYYGICYIIFFTFDENGNYIKRDQKWIHIDEIESTIKSEYPDYDRYMIGRESGYIVDHFPKIKELCEFM